MIKAFAIAAAVVALAPFLVAEPARAHALESSLQSVPGQTNALQLHSQFSSGEPAGGAVVDLVAPGQQPIALGRTDAAGQLRFERPSPALLAGAAQWELRIDQGGSHRDYLELPAPPASVAAPASARTMAPAAPPWFGWAGGGALLLIGAIGLRHIRPGR